jgi:Peptidase family M23
VTRRGGYAALAGSILIACLCAGLIAWRLGWLRLGPSPPAATGPAKPAEVAANLPPAKISPIIDAPGEPVLVRRGVVTAPKELLIAVPAKASQDVPKVKTAAYFVNSTLVSTTGGYMGKFPETGQDADALALQLEVNSDQAAGALTQAQIEAGTDDDSAGADPAAYVQGQPLTSANSNQLEVNPGGSQGRAQLKETILRTPLAEKISDLLIENGYAEESARMIESAAKESSHHIDTLPPQSVALAVGQLDVTGEYRAKQIAIFENGEYVVTIAAKDDGEYDEAAEPVIPPGLLDDTAGTVDAATHFTVADGVYSAGLRNGMPEAVIREAIQLISRLANLGSPLEAEQTMRVLFDRDFRDKAKSAGKVVYVGLHGGGASVDCYSFEGSDGFFRCFDPRAGSESKGAEPRARAGPASLGNSGATSINGILAPIRGAPVTSLYGMRFHPILHILRMHAGIDFGAPVGSEVRAAADGVVEFAGPAPGFGNHVRIKHAGFETSYSHLSEIPESIKPGAEVKQGDIIALSGNTGLSTGPHLHFEFYLNGDAVDPLPHLGAEIQSAAATLAAPVVGAAAAAIASSPGASAAEIASFPAIKAYIDDTLAHLQN